MVMYVYQAMEEWFLGFISQDLAGLLGSRSPSPVD
jgi:hypothetical protein